MTRKSIFPEVHQREFDPRDVYKLRYLDDDTCRDVNNIVRDLEEMWSVSYCCGEQLLGIVCCMEVNCNTVEIWMFLDKAMRKHLRYLYTETERLLESVNNLYTRIQCIVRTDWKAANKFVKRFGFEREGTLRCFGLNKEDYFIYSRIRVKKEG